MNEDPFEARVSRLSDYLIRAFKYDKPSILFALYLSEFFRADIENALIKHLKEQGLETVGVDAGKNKDLPSFFSLKNSRNVVFLAYGLEKGFPEVLNYLNFKREDLIEHKVKAVFWVTEKELSRISLEAPDFFAFRNRVVEFMELPLAEDRRPALIQFAMETEYKSLDAIRDSIDLKEKLLSELSGDDEISGYLLGSLGILYDQIGSYRKAIEYYEKALAIAQEIGDKRGEGNRLGNLGNAYSDLGQVKKAIEYYEKALAISQEIGDRRGEGADLGNLGNAYSDLGQVKKAIEYHEKALLIAQEIGDKRGEGNHLNNLGVAFENTKNYKEALACYLRAKDIRTEIKNPNLKTTESNIKKLEEKLGEKEFKKLETEVAPKAEEIVKSLLNKN